MANSSILIQFNNVPDVDDYFQINELSLNLSLYEIFKESRLATQQVTLPNFIPADGIHPDRYIGFVSTHLKTALDLDNNTTNLFTIEDFPGLINTGVGVIRITANFPNAYFTQITHSGAISITIDNQNPPPIIPPPIDPSLPVGNSVLPISLIFDVVADVASTPKSIAIVADTNWTIDETIIPTWLQLSQTTGTTNTIVSVNPINYSDFPEEQYTALINIIIGTNSFSIPITVNLIRVWENPFILGNINFTQELKYLSFNSRTPGTYIDFSIEIKTFNLNSYEPVIYTRNYKFPLFQGKGTFHVGTIAHDLFDEIKELINFVPGFNTNYLQHQYQPSEITISFEEKTFGPTVSGLIIREVPMILMAKGHKPFITENQTGLLTISQQEITRITPNSFIATSFVLVGAPRIIVKKNDVILDDFMADPIDKQIIYSYFRFINDVQPGDSIDLIILNGLEARSQRFLVFQNGMESTYFFFENNNGILEPYEFSGRRRISSTFKHVVSSKFKNLSTYDSKDKTNNVQSFIVNTGQLTKTDHRMITALIASRKVWCSFDNPDGDYFRVDSISTKITNQDTSINEESFDIEFNILENADASIYPH